MTCLECGQHFLIKSNRAICEELRRISIPLEDPPGLACPVEGCANASGELGFQKFGSTRSGSPRYRCRSCGKTTSASTKPTFRHRRADKNTEVLRLLVNKVPMRRIVEVAGISSSTLYRKLEHVSDRCVDFAAAVERRLPEMAFRHLDLASDRQDYLINWGAHVNRRSFMIRAIATTEARSGFVFGIHPNFDPTHALMQLELAARETGDHEKEVLDRPHPQYWLIGDYAAAANNKADRAQRRGSKPQNQPMKPIVSDPFQEAESQTPPALGVQLRQEYVLFAHFFHLRRLLANTEKVTLFLDPDSGLRAAVVSAFRKEIQVGTTSAFLVRSAKNLTVDQRKLLLANTESAFRRYCERMQLERHEAGITWLREQFAPLLAGRSPSNWVPHPFPDAAEPKKEVALLTLQAGSDPETLARSALYAGLKSVDRFFMLIRRRISLLERPISTPSSANRTWHGYSPYNPVVACRLLDLFRVVFNYHLIGEDKKTPAMRLGLCDQPYDLDAILATPRVAAQPIRPRNRAA